MDLRFVVVGSGRVGVILDHEADELRESVDGLEDTGRRSSSGRLVLDVAVYADLGADAEEEGGDLFTVEDALLLKLNDKVDKGLLDVVRLLVKSNPFGEAEGELFSNSRLVDGSLRDRNRSDLGCSRASFELLKEFLRAVGRRYVSTIQSRKKLSKD